MVGHGPWNIYAKARIRLRPALLLLNMLPPASRRRIPWVATLGLVVSVLEGAGVALLIPLVAFLWSSSGIPVQNLPPLLRPLAQWAASLQPWARIPAVSVAILSLVVSKVVIASINQRIIARSAAQLGGELRIRIADRLLEASSSFMSSTERARLLHVFSMDTYRIADGCYHVFQIVAFSASAAVLAAFLLVLDWRLFLVVLIGSLMVRRFGTSYSNRIKRQSERLTDQDVDLYHEMLQIVSAHRLFRLFGAESAARTRFARLSGQVRDTLYSIRLMAARAGQALELLQALALLVLLLTGFALGVALPAIVAFLVLLMRLQPNLLTIARAVVEFASLKGPIKGVEWLLQAEPAQAVAPAKTQIASLNEDLVFEDLSFHYQGVDVAALEGVSGIVPRGKVTALLGQSGAGKSTLVNLICRLIEPTQGNIRLGSTNIAAIDPAAWRRQIGLAGQDLDLIDGTILENIAIGAPEADREAIEAAAIAADADAFIRTFDRGYETRVGHRGTNLSGGQRQRIGLARALVRKPSLLVLDEALNAVDGISEETLLALLRARTWFETALIVSHRPSTISQCDVGLVLANGRLAEAGPLRSLEYYEGMLRSGAGQQVS